MSRIDNRPLFHDGKLFKDVSPLVREFAAEIRKNGNPPVQTEAEWLLRNGPKFGHRVIKDQARRTVRIVLEGEVK